MDRILLGKNHENQPVELFLKQLNRHGLIAGASGTGKTVTLKIIAEALSENGIPTVIADMKSDLSGMINMMDQSLVQKRIDELNISYTPKAYPVTFFDVMRKNGHPVRTILEEMDPQLFSRILDLSDVQAGVLNMLYQIAQDEDLDLIDLQDLQSLIAYVGENVSQYTLKYGNVTKQSLGAITRKITTLIQQGGDQLFGMPALQIADLFRQIGSYGVMNIFECSQLYENPLLYAMFMLWLLESIDEYLPEAGDLDQPKIVFFFDEAHTLFKDAPKAIAVKIEQTIKLIRSKGVGIIFCTQNPQDIPDAILSQISNRIQHALRAYTPNEIKAVKLASGSFRANPAFDTMEKITNLKTGSALVSTLDQEGIPCMVQETRIVPPASSWSAISPQQFQQAITSSALYGKYEQDVDPVSAFEKLQQTKQQEAIATQPKHRQQEQSFFETRLGKKIQRRAETEMMNFAIRSAKNLLKGFFK